MIRIILVILYVRSTEYNDTTYYTSDRAYTQTQRNNRTYVREDTCSIPNTTCILLYVMDDETNRHHRRFVCVVLLLGAASPCGTHSVFMYLSYYVLCTYIHFRVSLLLHIYKLLLLLLACCTWWKLLSVCGHVIGLVSQSGCRCRTSFLCLRLVVSVGSVVCRMGWETSTDIQPHARGFIGFIRVHVIHVYRIHTYV